jgi:Domain of unknown function (DUF892)
VLKHIDAEAIDAAAEPESHGVLHGLANLRIAPVQVGLLPEKGVVVLTCCGIELPRFAAELGKPIVGHPTAGTWVAPKVPVPARIAARAAARSIGLISEADELAGEVKDKDVMDAAIVGSAQAVEHYEIARYGT